MLKPPNKLCSCNSLNTKLVLADLGHLNMSFSKRLCHRTKPVLSQYSTFIFLRVRLVNTNRAPDMSATSSCCKRHTKVYRRHIKVDSQWLYKHSHAANSLSKVAGQTGAHCVDNDNCACCVCKTIELDTGANCALTNWPVCTFLIIGFCTTSFLACISVESHMAWRRD
jgi:hypothetical protein